MPPFLHSPLSATEWGYTSQRPYGTAPLIEMGLRSCSGRRLPEKTSRSPGGIKRPHFSNEKDYRREIGNVKQDFRIDFWTRRSKGSPSPRREHSRQSPMSPVFSNAGGFPPDFSKRQNPVRDTGSSPATTGAASCRTSSLLLFGPRKRNGPLGIFVHSERGESNPLSLFLGRGMLSFLTN